MRGKLRVGAAIAALGIGAFSFGLRTASAATQGAALKNGTFPGKRVNAFYGYIRVQAVVSKGKLTGVTMVEYPADNPRSRAINEFALPYLIQEAVSAQSYRVDFISGATFTSRAFMSSLQDALKAAGA